MTKTTINLLEETDNRLLKAITDCDITQLHSYVHPSVVVTNENGEVFNGISNMPENDPGVFKIKTVEIEEKVISFFDNIAIINAVEKRTGEFFGLHFEGQYRLTRIWKLNGRWKLIASTNVLI